MNNQQDYTNPRFVAETLCRYVNNYSWEGTQDEFIKAFVSEHRTLQQSAIQLLLNTLLRCGELYEHSRFDGRNEAAYKICKAIKDCCEEKELTYEGKVRLPCI